MSPIEGEPTAKKAQRCLKSFFVSDGQLFRRTPLGSMIIMSGRLRVEVQNTFQDHIGHQYFDSAVQFVVDIGGQAYPLLSTSTSVAVNVVKKLETSQNIVRRWDFV